MEIIAASTCDLSNTSCWQLFSKLEILSALLQDSCSPSSSRSFAKAVNPSCKEIALVLWHRAATPGTGCSTPWAGLLHFNILKDILYKKKKKKAATQGVKRQKKRKSGVTTSSSEGILFFSWLRKQLGGNCAEAQLGST